jgi:transcriptional regulator with XRE-family HTH domain
MTPIEGLGARIRDFRKSQGFTQQSLADAVGVSMHSIFRWESGERVPDAEDLAKLAEVLGTTVSYLMGEGKPQHRSFDEASNVKGPFVELIKLPILSDEITACCGDGVHLLELTSKTENFFFFPKDRIGRIDDLRPPFGVRSEGDSMVGYGVFDGALVAVNPAEDLRSGHIALVCIGDRVAVKKLYFRPTGIELKSSDGRSPTLISPEEQECGWFKVLGRVMGTIGGVDDEP